MIESSTTSGLSPQPSSLPDDVVLRVNNVSKKFCRNLKRSMWYGIQDLSRNLIGGGSAATGSSFLVPRSSLTKNQELGTMNTPQAYQERSTNNEARSTKHEELPPLRRDEFWALQNISFDLKRGECLGLSRLRKATARQVAGIFPPDAGEIGSLRAPFFVRSSSLFVVGAAIAQ